MLNAPTTRERIPERMDDPAIDPAEHRRALAALVRINRFSGSAGILWSPLAKLARRFPQRTISVLDIATGSGDVPIQLALRARRAGLDNLWFEGCDISATAIAEASANADRLRAPVGFFRYDILASAPPAQFEVVTCSLFLHHLSEDDAITLLRRMKELAQRLVLVNDLERSRFNFLAVWLACHILTRSPVVRFDGPASVRSAFTPREAIALAERAGLTGARAGRRWPCRFLMSWGRA